MDATPFSPDMVPALDEHPQEPGVPWRRDRPLRRGWSKRFKRAGEVIQVKAAGQRLTLDNGHVRVVVDYEATLGAANRWHSLRNFKTAAGVIRAALHPGDPRYFRAATIAVLVHDTCQNPSGLGGVGDVRSQP